MIEFAIPKKQNLDHWPLPFGLVRACRPWPLNRARPQVPRRWAGLYIQLQKESQNAIGWK